MRERWYPILSENLRSLRKEKGFSQEELASRLNVVRQTISKWEKGISVPDAEMLMKIAEIFEVSVSELLGKIEEHSFDESDENNIAKQLARVNEQLVIRNRRTKFVLRTILVVILAIVVFYVVMMIGGIVAYSNLKANPKVTVTEEVVVVEE